MKVAVLGGGPAGLYFSLLLKKADPAHEVTLLERNRPGRHVRVGRRLLRPDARELPGRRPGDVPGDHGQLRPLGRHRRPRPRGGRSPPAATASPASPASSCWRSSSTAPPSSGVDLRFGVEVRDDADLPGSGAGRRRPDRRGRRRQQRRPAAARGGASGPTSCTGKARFIWLGTTRPFDAFTFVFVENAARRLPGARLPVQRHALGLHRRVRRASWRNAGFDRLDIDATIAACEEMFAPWLDGHRLHVQHPAAPARGAVAQLHRASTAPGGGTGTVRAHRRRRAHRPLLHRLGHQARDGGRDRASPASLDKASRTSRRPCPPTRTSGAPRRCACRTRRATRWSGSRTCGATSGSSPSSSPTACSRAASA